MKGPGAHGGHGVNERCYGGDGGAASGGGLFFQDGDVVVLRSTISGNVARGGDGADGGDGGAGAAGNKGRDETISLGGFVNAPAQEGGRGGDGGHGGAGGAGGAGSGGGLHIAGGTLDLLNSTVADNQVFGGTGHDGGKGNNAGAGRDGGDTSPAISLTPERFSGDGGMVATAGGAAPAAPAVMPVAAAWHVPSAWQVPAVRSTWSIRPSPTTRRAPVRVALGTWRRKCPWWSTGFKGPRRQARLGRGGWRERRERRGGGLSSSVGGTSPSARGAFIPPGVSSSPAKSYWPTPLSRATRRRVGQPVIWTAWSMQASAYNLIGAGSGGLTQGSNGNLVGVADPRLGTLANNGGPRQTIAILPDSPGRDAGDNARAIDQDGLPLATDQRGTDFARVRAGTVDIGAFELQTDLSKITALRSTVKADEGAQAINFGAIGYLGTASANLDVTASEGTVTVFDDNTWVWFYTPADDQDVPTSVTVTAKDANGVPATVTYGLAVSNVAPTITTFSAPATATEG